MITTQKGDVMIMQILVNHVNPDDVDSKLHSDEKNTVKPDTAVVDSLLESVKSLTLRVADIDAIIDVLQDQKNFWAIKMGDSACDIVENEADEKLMSKAIDVGIVAAENLRTIRNLVAVMRKYREAAIKAGAK